MNRFLAFILAGLLSLQLFPAVQAQAAAPPICLAINGQIRQVSPGPRLVSGRVLVPLRYITEDPALGGKVVWNAENRTITIDCSGHKIILAIGSRGVSIDARMIQLDVAPEIYQNRTYIPLRFFSEAIGGTVGWKDRSKTVLINFGPPPIIMGYFYTGGPELLTHESMTDVVFRWLQADANGGLSYEYWKDSSGEALRAAVLEAARKQGLRMHVGVAFMGYSAEGRTALHQFLNSQTAQQALNDSLIEQARQYGYKGISLDFEGVPTEDRQRFVDYIAALSAKTKANQLTLSVAVPARTAGSTWHGGIDYAGIGANADLVILMAYDYDLDKPNPSAPIRWVENTAANLSSSVPKEKIILGTGTYGRDWTLTVPGRRNVYQETLDTLRQSAIPLTPGFDQTSFTPYIDYTDSTGNQHRIWYEDSLSYAEKRAVMLEKGFRGMSFWRLKGTFTDFYTAMGETTGY
ncbi:MAG: glycosyl hydrolase family 18 protein [Solirubrobacterales bacterium]